MPVDPHLLAVFTVSTIVALVTPGPDMLFVLGGGMRGGARAGLLATVGVITGDALHPTPPSRPSASRTQNDHPGLTPVDSGSTGQLNRSLAN